MKRRDLLLATGLSPLTPVRALAKTARTLSDSPPLETAVVGQAQLVAVAESLKPALRKTAQDWTGTGTVLRVRQQAILLPEVEIGEANITDIRHPFLL